MIIDVRTPDAYERGHVIGAVNIPAADIDRYGQSGLAGVDPGQLVIIYCNSAECDSADVVYRHLLVRGFTNLRVFAPGWAEARHLE